ncbi:hypothetical protein LEMLEM_LOCUS9043 [Lemmus lemmus]
MYKEEGKLFSAEFTTAAQGGRAALEITDFPAQKESFTACLERCHSTARTSNG